MEFTLTLSFATEHVRDAFAEHEMQKARGRAVEPAAATPDEGPAPARVAVAVKSPTAAKDVCRLIESFLRNRKDTRVDVIWTDAAGAEQTGRIVAGSPRDADLLAMRIGAVAKSVIDRERAAAAA